MMLVAALGESSMMSRRANSVTAESTIQPFPFCLIGRLGIGQKAQVHHCTYPEIGALDGQFNSFRHAITSQY